MRELEPRALSYENEPLSGPALAAEGKTSWLFARSFTIRS